MEFFFSFFFAKSSDCRWLGEDSEVGREMPAAAGDEKGLLAFRKFFFFF